MEFIITGLGQGDYGDGSPTPFEPGNVMLLNDDENLPEHDHDTVYIKLTGVYGADLNDITTSSTYFYYGFCANIPSARGGWVFTQYIDGYSSQTCVDLDNNVYVRSKDAFGSYSGWIWVNGPYQKLNKNIADPTYTLLASDVNVWLTFSNDCTVTIPAGLTHPSLFEGQTHPGATLTFEAATGVTINKLDTIGLTLSPNGVFGIRFNTTDNCILYGTDPI